MKFTLLLSILGVLTFPATSQACATCLGGDNVNLINASNTVLWALLSLVGFIFVATGSTVYFLWRRAKSPLLPHLTDNSSSPDAED